MEAVTKLRLKLALDILAELDRDDLSDEQAGHLERAELLLTVIEGADPELIEHAREIGALN